MQREEGEEEEEVGRAQPFDGTNGFGKCLVTACHTRGSDTLCQVHKGLDQVCLDGSNIVI